jgi:hypothetical protein
MAKINISYTKAEDKKVKIEVFIIALLNYIKSESLLKEK